MVQTLVRKVNNSRQIIIGGLLTFTSLDEAMEIRNCLAAIEMEERKNEIEEKENELKEKEEKIQQKERKKRN